VGFRDSIQEWIEDAELDHIRTVLAGFKARGDLAREFQALFAKQREEGARLVATGLASLEDERLLERLPKILEVRPDVIKHLLEAWLRESEVELDELSVGEWPFAPGSVPRPEWWAAAARFLEAKGLQPRWEWLGFKWQPSSNTVSGQEKSEENGKIHVLQARLKKTEASLEKEQRARNKCEQLLQECRNALSIKEHQLETTLQAAKVLEADFMQLQRKLEGSTERIHKLERQINRLKEKLRACEARLIEARTYASDPEPMVSKPAPFDPEDLKGVWVIPYRGLGDKPLARLTALLEMYEAALRKRDHPALARTNWRALEGHPRGLLLLDTDRLLDDMVKLPLSRWLQASLFSREAYLYSLRRWVRERSRSLLEGE